MQYLQPLEIIDDEKISSGKIRLTDVLADLVKRQFRLLSSAMPSKKRRSGADTSNRRLVAICHTIRAYREPPGNVACRNMATSYALAIGSVEKEQAILNLPEVIAEVLIWIVKEESM